MTRITSDGKWFNSQNQTPKLWTKLLKTYQNVYPYSADIDMKQPHEPASPEQILEIICNLVNIGHRGDVPKNQLSTCTNP